MKNKIIGRISSTFIAFLLITATLLSLTSCTKDRVYCELGITLPSEFKKKDTEGAFDVAYSNDELVVGITRLSFEACIQDSIPTTLSARKFADFYRDVTKKEDISTNPREEGDVVYYSYTSKVESVEYFYMPTFYRTPYAYFIIMFVCPSAISELMEDQILDYASTVFIKD